MLPQYSSRCRWLAVGCLLFGALGCSHTEDKPAPQDPLETTIRIKSTQTAKTTGKLNNGVVEKRLLNILMSNRLLTVNGVSFNSLKDVRKLLASAEQPVVTISSHKCLSNEKAAELIALVQNYTTTPITFASYGSFDDPECQ